MNKNIVSTDSQEHIDSILTVSSDGEKETKKEAATEELASTGESSSDSADGEGSGDNESSDKNKEPAKKSKGDARFDKMTKELSLAKQEADLWRTQALKGGAGGETKTESEKEPKVEEKPKADDFNTHDDYIEALTEFKAKKIVKETLDKRDADKVVKERQASQITVFDKWELAQDEARKVYKDYDEVTDQDIPITEVVRETFLESEVGAHLAYWWGQNPEEAKRLVKLSPVACARELGKIEDRLVIQLAKTSKDQTQTKTPAIKPNPINPLGGGGKGKTEVSLDDKELPYTEWLKERNRQLKIK